MLQLEEIKNNEERLLAGRPVRDDKNARIGIFCLGGIIGFLGCASVHFSLAPCWVAFLGFLPCACCICAERDFENRWKFDRAYFEERKRQAIENVRLLTEKRNSQRTNNLRRDCLNAECEAVVR